MGVGNLKSPGVGNLDWHSFKAAKRFVSFEERAFHGSSLSAAKRDCQRQGGLFGGGRECPERRSILKCATSVMTDWEAKPV